MNLDCNQARPLVPAYLDGELSETQAGLLRKHLLECPSCRGAVQDGKSLERWFAAARESAELHADSPVPSGFAARIARRAFAGDTGESDFASGRSDLNDPERGRLLRFVLQVTSVAAVLLIALSLGMRLQELPSGNLRADDRTLVSVEEIQRECERLERAEKGLPPLPEEPAMSFARNAKAPPSSRRP